MLGTSRTDKIPSNRAFRPPPASAPDSVHLAAMGVAPGRHLLAYVLVGSHCGYCQREDTKEAIRSIHTLMQRHKRDGFQAVTIIGVGVDADLREGLAYIDGVGLSSFDEVSVGNAWLNESLVHLVWRGIATEPAVPQVVLVARDLKATINPLLVKYGADSVLRVVNGYNELLEWVRGGVQIRGASDSQSRPGTARNTSAGKLSW